ncbi:hypothetical protein PPERSA_06400 [Pseudocohnilembus persalinus]|uniref:Hypoxanthine phosphoribosyltransferase n=1 Tax=Pseudocohnilembus persalinus TaxID=266149 RepID=A0A0V0Q991_PSEPJ|nr:hypothetical protein PPERSA_06400 [Pseudocohnilembus persalinus]|eukprot:KRW98596.1 hypothetical protein PPERSA_06400 [Pseudocohnilembus persalinus]
MDPSVKFVEHKGLKFQRFISKEKIDKETVRVANEISKDYSDKNPLFIGILNGAFIWTADLVRQLSFYNMEVEWCKVSSYEGTESVQMKQLVGFKQSIEGRHVIIVEDIVDSGKTMDNILIHLKSMKPASVSIATLFFKKENCKFDIPVKYQGFEIPNTFIIGYGLDFDEFGRNLPEIWHNCADEEKLKQQEKQQQQ